eukprot:1061452-Amphidinium_carterae.1
MDRLRCLNPMSSHQELKQCWLGLYTFTLFTHVPVNGETQLAGGLAIACLWADVVALFQVACEAATKYLDATVEVGKGLLDFHPTTCFNERGAFV